MFGAFRPSSSLSGGLLWKIPWRLSKPRKMRQRRRLRAVDAVVDTLESALGRQGLTAKAIERWRAEMPREEQMTPKDKYTLFDRKEKSYRKGVHSTLFRGSCRVLLRTRFRWIWFLKEGDDITMEYRSSREIEANGSIELPKWTRVSQRINPPGF